MTSEPAPPRIAEQKRRLRRAARSAILALGPDLRQKQERALRSRLTEAPRFHEGRTILLYVSAFPEEIDTAPLLTQALEAGRRLACPRVDRAASRLTLHRVVDPARDLVPGVLQIPEPREDLEQIPPEEIDWALVPGLAFDGLGTRLGRGAGHYDRLLPRLRPDTPAWAMAFDVQFYERLPRVGHDQPVDGLVLPDRLLSGWPRRGERP